jgi:hypothetical protein
LSYLKEPPLPALVTSHKPVVTSHKSPRRVVTSHKSPPRPAALVTSHN